MIYVDNKPLDTVSLERDYGDGSVERKILNTLATSNTRYTYDSLGELKFELKMRREIIEASKALNNSDFAFEIFRESRSNPEYWIRQEDGGFQLKPGVKASDAIRDIFRNGSKYGTECATAMQIVYYKALLEIFPESAFNRLFSDIYLMNWHGISRELRGIGTMRPVSDYLPGDRRYFANPDVDPKTPEWQGENVIDLGDGRYYGHGIGIHRAGAIIDALNENRRPGADRDAYLMDSAGRPDFKYLWKLYDRAVAGASGVRQTA